MEENFLKVIEQFKEKTKLPCMAIELVDKEPNILDNKIGGKPYLPEGEKYPTDSKGEPMALLLQIDLKDVDLPNYTNRGTLEIFCSKKISLPLEYQIKYFDSALKYQTDLPDVDISEFMINKAYKINVMRSESYMSIYDYRFISVISPIMNSVFGVNINSIEDMDNFFKDYKWDNALLEETYTKEITIGGYPNFTSKDPRVRMQNKLNECVFKMDSLYDENIIHIGDEGIIFLLMDTNDLKMNLFEKSFLTYDCF